MPLVSSKQGLGLFDIWDLKILQNNKIYTLEHKNRNHLSQKNTPGNIFESLIDIALEAGIEISWASDLDRKYSSIWRRLFSDSNKYDG